MSKISELDELLNVAYNDLIEVVDISDATMSTNGTNKKTTRASLIQKKNYDMQDAAFTLISAFHNRPIDCNRATTQTVTIDTLTSDHDGAEMIITKWGAGDVTVVLPSGVTWADDTTDNVTIGSAGRPCTLRYNHSLLKLAIDYYGDLS